MAPTYEIPILSTRTASGDWHASAQELRQQWTQPSDVFSVLLLLGGEIVGRALAQLAGGLLCPVTFSFGWASYAITLLLASVGDARLMPTSPDGACLVVHGKSGFVRNNNSWILGRLVRDYELWMDPAAHTRLDHMLVQRHKYLQKQTKPGTVIPRPDRTGLCIAIYEPSKTINAGTPVRDLVYWSGLLVMLVQLAVASIPIATSSNWSVLMITVAGTVLAFSTGSLPQWKEEKWSCRRSSHSTYSVTRGNGSQHAIVVLGNGHGLNFDDLAVAGQPRYPARDFKTRIFLAIICLLWVVLLVAAAGVRTHTWYLLAVGGIGIVQNVIVAGWRRDPSALGIHLEFKDVIGEMETMESLLKLEEKYPYVGRSLLPIFFPGELLLPEATRWQNLKMRTTQSQQPQSQGQAPLLVPNLESWTSHAKSFEKA